MGLLNFCAADNSKVPEILNLWQKTYGDDKEFIERCIYEVAGLENVYLAFYDKEIAAMLLAIPCELKSQLYAKQGIYLYALATKEYLRGKGIMSRLVAYAEKESNKKGAVFSALIPASDNLFAFYNKLGYNREIKLRKLNKKIENGTSGSSCFNTINGRQFKILRSKYALINQSYIDFGVKKYAVILKDLYSSDVGFAQTNEAYAFYKKSGNELLVLELFAKNDEAADNMLSEIAYENKCGNFIISLGEGSELYKGHGESQRFAMIKNLDFAFADEKLYLRFGLDEAGTWILR